MVPEGQRWSTATTSIACEWSVDRIELITGLYREGGPGWYLYPAAPVREGFWIEEGCRLSDSAFLPALLQGYHNGPEAVIHRGDWSNSNLYYPWYNAALTTTWHDSRSYVSTWTPGNYVHRWSTFLRTGSAQGGVEFVSFP